MILVFPCDKASAYCILGSGCPQSGTGWPGAAATFNSNGFSGSNSTFDTAFVDALNSWNNLSNFSYSSINAAVDPCPVIPDTPNSTRGWGFTSDVCGTPFGSTTLAITLIQASSFSPSINNIIDADIFFNSDKTWVVHSGPGSDFDFKRVAVHELGHALGLDHETTNTAIMAPFYSQTIEEPQADDIKGLTALYDGPPLPDIKANSSDGPVTPTDNLSVTVTLDPGNSLGVNADWWAAANVSGTGTTFDGWHYFHLISGWVFAGASFTDLLFTHQGSLFDLTPPFEILNTSTSVLPPGTYTFYFAVDMNKNGSLDLDELFFDSVTVVVL